jgi:hypothetical protein
VKKNPDVPQLYRRMLAISGEMLTAAEHEEWNKLIALEQERTGVVEALQMSPNLVPDEQKERDVLIGLIHEIQGLDDKVKPMILAWMSELRSMFESAGNEIKLGRKYSRY